MERNGDVDKQTRGRDSPGHLLTTPDKSCCTCTATLALWQFMDLTFWAQIYGRIDPPSLGRSSAYKR